MGDTRGLVRIYRGMRLALLVSIPAACALFFYAVTGNAFISGFSFVVAFLTVLEETPEPKEVKRMLKRKVDAPDGMIWYMIEEKETGNVRLYK